MLGDIPGKRDVASIDTAARAAAAEELIRWSNMRAIAHAVNDLSARPMASPPRLACNCPSASAMRCQCRISIAAGPAQHEKLLPMMQCRDLTEVRCAARLWRRCHFLR